MSDLQAEKRGNFVVLGCIEGGSVVSWSLNVSIFITVTHCPLFTCPTQLHQALNNSETLRLLASIELACYKCSLAVIDPRTHAKIRRRIERIIKEDRRRRHKRRKDHDSMIDAFSRQHLDEDVESLP